MQHQVAKPLTGIGRRPYRGLFPSGIRVASA